MCRGVAIVAALSALVLSASAGAQHVELSEHRLALIIGNGDYDHISGLRNPGNDARAMAQKLRELGFEVMAHSNLDQEAMKRAIREFGQTLTDRSVGLFYYSGHGVQVNGINYMIPVSARIEAEADIDIETVRINRVLAEFEKAGNRLNFLILDACRNNTLPRADRAAAQGLAFMNAPAGTLIAYATEPGDVASDGIGKYSLYTEALLRAMSLPGLSVDQMFMEVRAEVIKESFGDQTPWEATSVTGTFFFRPDPGASAGGDPRAAAPTETTYQPTPGIDRETVFWQSIQNSRNPADFEAYLIQFPDGFYAPLARNRLAELAAELPEVAMVAPAEPEAQLLPPPEAPPPPEPGVRIERRDEERIVLNNANVRAGPSTDFDRIGLVERGTTVMVTGKVIDANWFQIAHAGGGIGYVYGSLLGAVTAPPVAQRLVPPRVGGRRSN